MGWVPIVVALAAAAQGAADPEHSSAVSIDRIRAALAKPPSLTLPSQAFPPPTFSIMIIERQRFLHLSDPFDVESGPTPFGGLYYFEQQQQLGTPWAASRTAIGVPVLPMIHAAVRSIAKWRYQRAERAARDEVRRALAEFCAVHKCDEP